eukprot:CAMPEP_0117017424 /NCGR_PEP_ID=MMETSP0472-20121206/13605_1 /TAXON_ID=693140 ORGANISM="Tiarina fusus, Strain LIS" /NCGR_SAMPLE_ID=MMETSP0472 /ASSEMBLY_ACC=CAM_ASM_000603 /LENGTH=290 /DNA_ID=CAMNT_0004721781 /DNA_START=101 /DNA_END=973 /DNA_ORIENTATION=-
MVRLLVSGLLAVSCSVSIAFIPSALPRPDIRRSGNFGIVLKSEPSDTSSDPFYDDDVVTVESEDYNPTDAEALVTSVLDMIPKSLGGVDDGKRAEINEVLLRLEALNPTQQPTSSPLLNGVWELRYAAGYSAEGALPSPTRQLALFLYSGGYSPGLFALSLAQKLPASVVDVGDLEISISREQPRVEAKVEAKSFFGDLSVVVKAKLDVESGQRLRETYESASVMGRSIELPQMIQYSRQLFVTYVDDELMIVRDATGVPELLVRKEKIFSKNWGTEPSEVDDLSAPGEE